MPDVTLLLHAAAGDHRAGAQGAHEEQAEAGLSLHFTGGPP